MSQRIAACIIALLAFGCERPPVNDQFYFISGSVSPGIDIFVNGNPTNDGNALSLFLVDGENSMELRGNFSENGYDLRIFKAKSIFDKNAEMVVEQQMEPSDASKHRTIEFQAESPWHWAWQGAEKLGPLSSKDQSAIYAIYDNVCDEIAGDQFEIEKFLSRSDIVYWSDDRAHVSKMKQQIKQLGSKIPPRSELAFKKVMRDELQMLSGKQIVMLSSSEDKLVYLGPPKNDSPPDSQGMKWTFSYGFSEMFFVKIDGAWKLMIPNL